MNDKVSHLSLLGKIIAHIYLFFFLILIRRHKALCLRHFFCNSSVQIRFEVLQRFQGTLQVLLLTRIPRGSKTARN